MRMDFDMANNYTVGVESQQCTRLCRQLAESLEFLPPTAKTVISAKSAAGNRKVKQEIKMLLDREVREYVLRNPRSKEMSERAKASLPGGNTRTGMYVDPFPPYAERGEGPYIHDVDGHRLLDFVNNASALILGHAAPEIVTALQDRVARGTAFSLPTELEIEMAELLRARVPSLEKVRFCSSGSEAVLNSIRVARAFTGRSKIAKFEGAFHGLDDRAMISYAPPVVTAIGTWDDPLPVLTPGLAPATADEVVVLPFNDAAACERIIAANAARLAAVVVDPLSTSTGLTLPIDDFLTRLRSMTRAANVLLIFDEIISFRVAPGGAQEYYEVRPDLSAFGKVVAGGTAGAAFGGRADVMARYDPALGSERLFQSGTYNANPIAMVAGLVTLRSLTRERYDQLAESTRRLGSALQQLFDENQVDARVTTIGSIFRILCMDAVPRNYRESAREDEVLHRFLFFWLINRGIYWKQGGYLSLAMEQQHLDSLVKTLAGAVEQL